MRERLASPMRLPLYLCLLAVACVGQEHDRYIFGFLRAHPERAELPAAEAAAIQKAHLAHLEKMARDGYLVGAGPLGGSSDLRGILIFRGITLDRAREAASQDPAVINKRLRVHVEEWRAARGIGETLARNMQDAGFQMKMARYGFLVTWLTPQAPPDWRARLGGHIAWLEANAARIAAGGPFAGSSEFLGVAIFRSTDLEEAGRLAAADPFVKAGWARPELLTLMVAEGVMPESR